MWWLVYVGSVLTTHLNAEFSFPDAINTTESKVVKRKIDIPSKLEAEITVSRTSKNIRGTIRFLFLYELHHKKFRKYCLSAM